MEFAESPGFYSYVYNYYFENFGQFYAQAGGRGRYISATGRGRMLTDFNGYGVNFANDTCLTYSAEVCKEIQPGVLYMEQRPNAATVCHWFENYAVTGVSTLAFVGVNLPEHEQITGFIFAAPILPEAVQSNLLSLLDSDGTMSGCQDPDKIARFDAEVEAFYTSLHNQTADPVLMTQYQQMLHLAHSILPDVIPTLPPSPSTSPLQTPAPQDSGWQTFSHHNAVSLEYPTGWDVVRDGTPEDWDEFFLMIRPKDGFHVQVIVTARMVPKIEEPTLYHYAGEVIETRQMGPYQTVWDKQITSRNHLDWHLTIRGFSPFTGRYDGLAYIAQAGGLTGGTIEAVHYDPTRELAILISKDLDRDMLIALHEAGPDAVYPAMVAVFEEILQSVAIVDQTAQLTVPDAYTGAYHYRITYPTAAWRVEVVGELEGYALPPTPTSRNRRLPPALARRSTW